MTNILPSKRAGAQKKDDKNDGKKVKFQDYQFNVTQVSDQVGISRNTIYLMEKNKGPVQEVAKGSITKMLFSWDELASIVTKFNDKIVKPKDAKIKVFANLKGGVGKSSLASQFAMRASAGGLKTLLIDLDPQGHATLALGFDDVAEEKPTILNCLVGKGSEKLDISEVIQPITPLLSLIPANLSLSTVEIKLNSENRRVEKLKEILSKVRNEWDLIVIDTNPSASLLNLNALLAADELCVVCATDFFSVTGLKALFQIYKDLEEDFPFFGPAVKIIPNLFDVREAIAQESLGMLRQGYKQMLTNTVVRKNVDLKEAQKGAQAVWLYNRRSSAAEDIIALTRELIAEND